MRDAHVTYPLAIVTCDAGSPGFHSAPAAFACTSMPAHGVRPCGSPRSCFRCPRWIGSMQCRRLPARSRSHDPDRRAPFVVRRRRHVRCIAPCPPKYRESECAASPHLIGESLPASISSRHPAHGIRPCLACHSARRVASSASGAGSTSSPGCPCQRQRITRPTAVTRRRPTC